MKITEVRIKLMENADDRLRAFCSITFDDCFVVRDLKIIDGVNGPFVAMPSRKLTSHCPHCKTKNHLRAVYCNQCGRKLEGDRTSRDQDGRTKLYADIAHPINSRCREMIQNRVIAEYEKELERAKQPGYVSRYDEAYAENGFEDDQEPRGQAEGPSALKGTSHIEPPESTPPPPHQKPADVPSASQKRHANDQFGAGIFDD